MLKLGGNEKVTETTKSRKTLTAQTECLNYVGQRKGYRNNKEQKKNLTAQTECLN